MSAFYIDLIVVIVILGLAFIIKSFEESSREFKRPFMMIVGLFIVLYICASFFLSYRIGAWGATTSNSSSDGLKDVKVIDTSFQEVDLSTPY